jgi:hypothetical protein
MLPKMQVLWKRYKYFKRSNKLINHKYFTYEEINTPLQAIN